MLEFKIQGLEANVRNKKMKKMIFNNMKNPTSEK